MSAKKRIGIRIPESMVDALQESCNKHGITMTKYILRLLYMALTKEGYLKDPIDKSDIYMM